MLTAGAAALVCALALAVTFRTRQLAPAVPNDRVAVARLRIHLDDLSAQIRDKRRVIEGLLDSERRRALAISAQALPWETLETDRDRAAGTLMVYASELVRRAGRQHEAAGAYARVIDLFPDSPLAAAARQNLKTIEP